MFITRWAFSRMPGHRLPTWRVSQTRRSIVSTTQPSQPLRAAFCVIGDEILNGKVMDNNSHYFANKCFGMGIELRRIAVVSDSCSDIGECITQLSAQNDLVFTSGGIGPTHDDITYSAIARALNKDLEYHQDTLARMRRIMIRNNKRSLTLPDPNGTPEQAACSRMALFPKDSKVTYPCEKYWVPVVCAGGNVHIFPGIPELFRELVDAYLPYLVSSLSKVPAQPYTRALIGTAMTESHIAPILERLQGQFADSGLKLGSYPDWTPNGSLANGRPPVVLSIVGKDRGAVVECQAKLCELVSGTDLGVASNK